MNYKGAEKKFLSEILILIINVNINNIRIRKKMVSIILIYVGHQNMPHGPAFARVWNIGHQ